MPSKYYWTFIILFIISGHSVSQSIADDRLNALDKGCNLSNWLEAFWFPEGQYPPEGLYAKEDIQAMKMAGMNNVRLNVNFERFLDDEEPFEVNLDHEAFSWIDSILKWTAEEDMMVVLCNQHGWDELNDFTYSSISPRIIALWDQLGFKYKDTDPNQLLLEVINEPPALLSRSKTRMLMDIVVQTIRSHTIDHTIVVSGSLGSHASEMPNTIPLTDDNLIYTFHYYEPFYFTHQGASWTPIYFPVGATFPTGFFNDENAMRNHFLRIHNWRQLYRVPVYMGELGTINYADEVSKCNWISLMGELIDQYDMVWSYWDCKFSSGDRFGFFDGDTISPLHIRQCYRNALHLYDDGLPTVIADQELEEYLVVPNPAINHITLSTRDFQHAKSNVYDIMIIDAIGRPVLRLDGLINQSQIDVEPLPPGVYMITLSQNGKLNGMARFIKS